MSGGEMFLAKCDAAGSVVWARNSATTVGPNAEGTGGAIAKDVGVDAAGNMYITGTLEDFESSGSVTHFGAHALHAQGVDIFIAKYDPAGQCLWAQRAGSAGKIWEKGTGIAVDAAGNSYVTGHASAAAPVWIHSRN
jgi:hypothetical protein